MWEMMEAASITEVCLSTTFAINLSHHVAVADVPLLSLFCHTTSCTIVQ